MGNRRAKSDIRSASFSDYLNQDPLPTYVLPTPALPKNVRPGEEGEIDVFNAKKYFNANPDAEAATGMKKGMSGFVSRPDSSRGTPFAGSDLSGIQVPKRKDEGVRRQGILLRFSCSGLCSDEESVQVSKESRIKKLNSHGAASGSEFEFPILRAAEEQQQRKSLDVFGLDGKSKGGADAVAINLERKLSMLTWDAIPKAQSLPIPPGNDAATRADEAESCTSSDLFEIESISAICRTKYSSGKRSGGSSRFSFSGCKAQKAVDIAEPMQETGPK